VLVDESRVVELVRRGDTRVLAIVSDSDQSPFGSERRGVSSRRERQSGLLVWLHHQQPPDKLAWDSNRLLIQSTRGMHY